MICDFDDHSEHFNALPHLERLHALRPDFCCTLFAVPAHGSPDFWASHPDWVELAIHGWHHGGPDCPDPYEASAWTYERAAGVLAAARRLGFTAGFKAPGWQISDATYQACLDAGVWVADQPYNDERRPAGLRVHRLSPTASSGQDPAHWHGHAQNVCGNGIEETWDALVAAVKQAPSFEFVSEAVRPWTG